MPRREARKAEHARRLKAHRAGKRAERLAILCLRLKGYRVIARRYLVKGGEIDIIARRGSILAFVEVKRRGTLDEAMMAISSVKRRRISRAALVFVSRQSIVGLTLRGDAVYCVPWRWPVHVPAAFELDFP